jgi:hypothetical protein
MILEGEKERKKERKREVPIVYVTQTRQPIVKLTEEKKTKQSADDPIIVN